MATFGLKYYAELRSKYKSIIWRVEIDQRGYAGAAEKMEFAGSEPLQITWERRGDEFYAPVKASEASIKIMCFENFQYLSLFTSDPRKFRVSIYRGGVLYWRGYLTADLYSENFDAPPYEVTIKAIDGFNLLSSYIFKDLIHIGTSGRCTLYFLISKCLDLLELDMPISDWLDLYADGMSENESVFMQTYIDLERLYYVYENPTYRDILELCLLPFAAQIFQSNGSLHIRRTISLYHENRPASYFNIGGVYPSGYLMADDEGTHISAADNTLLVTASARDVFTDMWAKDLNVLGESNLDIVPAVRKVGVDVKNKSLGDLVRQFRYFDLSGWNDPYQSLEIDTKIPSLTLCGDDDHQNTIAYSAEVDVEQCNYPLIWEFKISVYSRTWSSGSYTRPTSGSAVTVYYGVRIVGTSKTYYLTESGKWSDTDTNIVTEVKTGEAQSMKVDIDGIPCDGKWQFYIVQTLVGNVYSTPRGGTTGTVVNATFRDMTLSIDAGDLYDKGLQYQSLINPANNVDLQISLPVSDIPNIPNEHLLYSLYFLTRGSQPTRLWHTKGKNYYDTLVGHIVQEALTFKQLPSKRITGEIFTSLHVDMNTVINDSLYTNAGYSINSIELKALDDTYNCELVEMPRFNIIETPADGDDCILVSSFSGKGIKVIRSMNFLFILTSTKKVLRFDCISRSVNEIYSGDALDIYYADDGFVIYESDRLLYCDHNAKVQRILGSDLVTFKYFHNWATFRDGYFIVFLRTESVGANYTRIFYNFMRPEIATGFTRGSDYSVSSRNNEYEYSISGTPQSIVTTENAIVINSSSGCYLNDKRLHDYGTYTLLSEEFHISSISDDYFIANHFDDKVCLYKRNSVTEFTLVDQLGEYAQFSDINLTQVVHTYDSPAIWNIRTKEQYFIKNKQTTKEPIATFFLYGDLYIITEDSIYKLIR